MTNVLKRATLTATGVAFRIDPLKKDVHVFVSRDLNDLARQVQDYKRQLAAKHHLSAEEIEDTRLNSVAIAALETAFTAPPSSPGAGSGGRWRRIPTTPEPRDAGSGCNA